MSLSSKSRFQNRRHNSSTSSPPSTFTVHTSFNSMFHTSQESATLYNEFMQRNINCYEQKRHAEYQRVHRFEPSSKVMMPTLTRQQLPTAIRLTIEVQCSDFSSLHDGREAWAVNDSLSSIMAETDCMIQFSNHYDEETNESMGIFNQVTIAGNFPNIDIAMSRIRALCPITIAVPLKNLKDDLEQKDLLKMIRQWCKSEELCEFTRVQFSILYPPNLYSPPQNGESNNNSPSLVIRASRKDAKLMTQASETVIRLLFKEPRQTFYAYLKIPASQRRMIAGSPEGVLVRAISTQTNATIHYQNRSKSSTVSPSSTNYYLSGAAGAVIQAVKALQDIGPVRIEFEAEDHHLVNSIGLDGHREVDQFDIERSVIIQLRKSPYEGGFRLEREGMRHSLTLMTSEENIQNLYKVRQQLLDETCWKQERPTKQQNLQNGKNSTNAPRYMDYLKVLVMESAMRAYIGERKVISVCCCNNNNSPQHHNNHNRLGQQQQHKHHYNNNNSPNVPSSPPPTSASDEKRRRRQLSHS